MRVRRECPGCGAVIEIVGEECDVTELVMAWWGLHGGVHDRDGHATGTAGRDKSRPYTAEATAEADGGQAE